MPRARSDSRAQWERRGTVGGDGMSVLAFIAFIGLLHGVGLYNPTVVVNGHCIAKPGSYAILLCPPETWQKHDRSGINDTNRQHH